MFTHFTGPDTFDVTYWKAETGKTSNPQLVAKDINTNTNSTLVTTVDGVLSRVENSVPVNW